MAALPVRPSSPASALAARSQGLNQKYDLPPKAAPKPPAPRPPAQSDPYANPQAYIAKVLAGLGTPLDEAGIQAHAQAQLSPLVQALTDSLTRQAQSGTAAIKGYTNSLANALAGYGTQAQNIYGGAEQAQAASDAALAQRLTGGGAQQSQELAGKLASINAPGAVNQAVTQQAGVGVGAGNALYGTGSASLANLIAQGAGAQDYAAKLPKIADLSGVQQVGQLQGQIANKQAEGLSTLQGQIPGIVSSLEGQQQTLRQNRVQTRTQLDKFFSDRAAQQKALKQEAQLAGIKAASKPPTTRSVGGNLYELNPKTGQWALAIAAPPKSASSTPTTKSVGGSLYQWDPGSNSWKVAIAAPPKTTSSAKPVVRTVNGTAYQWNGTKWAPAAGIPAKGPKSTQGTGANRVGVNPQFPNLTGKDVRKLRSGVANAYYGYTDRNNKKVAPFTYQEAIQETEKAGYSHAAAVKMANRFYTQPWQRKGGWTYGKPGP